MKLIKSAILIFILLLAVQVEGWCATKYLRSVGGNFSANETWSTTSNGSADTTAPTSSDDVVCDPNSGSAVLTINTTVRECKSLDCTGFTGTFNMLVNLRIYGDFILGSNMEFNQAGSINLLGEMTHTINTNGKSLLTIYINYNSTTGYRSNGTYSLLNDFFCGSTLAFPKGILNTNNYNITATTLLNPNNSLNTIRTYNLGTSVLTFKSFDMSDTGGLTFNYDTSTVIVNQSATGAMSFSPGTAQFYNLTLNGHASAGCYKAFTGDLTVNNTLTIAGNSSTNKLALKSSDTTVRTITAPTVNISNIDYYQNIKGAGDGWIGKVPFFNSASSWNPNMKYSGVLR